MVSSHANLLEFAIILHVSGYQSCNIYVAPFTGNSEDKSIRVWDMSKRLDHHIVHIIKILICSHTLNAICLDLSKIAPVKIWTGVG